MKRLLVGLVLVVLVAGCAGQGATKESVIANPAAAMADCAKAPDAQKDDCFMFISDVLRTVNVTASYEACTDVSSPENSKQNPRQDCVQGLIDAQNDTDVTLKVCRLIDRDDWKKNCIEDLANEEQNQTKVIEICGEISDNNFRQHCYGNIGNSPGVGADVKLLVCDSNTGTEKDNCYRNVAEGLFETDLPTAINACNKISDSNSRSACLNIFISSPELVKANTDLAISTCGTFSALGKSRCYNDLARTLSGSDQKKAAYVCQKLGDDVQISDCYSNVWFYSNQLVLDNYDYSVSMCNVLTLKRDSCLNNIVSVFIDVDRAKAEATCLLMSAASSQNCVNGVHR